LIEKYVAVLKVSWAIDVGVGPASIGFLSKFGPLGAKILGIEPLVKRAIVIEDQDLAQYIKKLQDRVRYVQAKGESLPTASSSFDLAVRINVLDHTEMPGCVLDSIQNCLRDKGILLLGVNVFSVLGRMKFETLRLVLGDKRQNFLAHPYSGHGKTWIIYSLIMDFAQSKAQNQLLKIGFSVRLRCILGCAKR
jgi:SAM-dependent methyltransferase